jgi:hypothetical protein
MRFRSNKASSCLTGRVYCSASNVRSQPRQVKPLASPSSAIHYPLRTNYDSCVGKSEPEQWHRNASQQAHPRSDSVCRRPWLDVYQGKRKSPYFGNAVVSSK